MSGSQALDPRLFRPEAMSAEMRALVAALEQGPSPSADLPRTPEQLALARKAPWERFGLPDYRSPLAQVLEIPGPAGPLALRVFRPRGRPRGALLHIHGGGWVYGAPDMMDTPLERLCTELGLAVASVDYRLAPEHPYPAAPDDCEAAALWLVDNAARELGTDRLAIGGESAGGHLSAVTAVRMRRRHGYRFRGANLVFGVYDLSGVPSHTQLDGRNLILDSRNIEWFTGHFAPRREQRRDPDLSPLYADLSDLCPALFTVGTLDPLLDHSLFMYTRWIAAGNDAELAVYPGGPHGFTAFAAPEAREANARSERFLVECLER
jgi:acetyl esterase/lipase